MSDHTTQLDSRRTQRPAARSFAVRVMLTLVASRTEAHRIGEVLRAPLDGKRGVWGRSEESCDLEFLRLRPGSCEPCGFANSPGISRAQLALATTNAGGLSLENVGRRALRVNGRPTAQALVKAGDLVELDGEMLFVASEYPPEWAPSRWAQNEHEFAAADDDGIVGESPATWALRDDIAFVSAASGHVLFLGESGAGKDLAAAAVARRTRGPYVARSAATLPEGLVEAELFGSAKNYPGSGMPARAGLVGEANGGALFLDEIAELPVALQTRLLRVLDASGEYHALGDARARQSTFRLFAATNQSTNALRADLNARFEHRVDLPLLAARGADCVLIARALVARLALEQPNIFGRFIDEVGVPALSFGLVKRIVRHTSPGGVRSIRTLLLLSARTSPGDVLLNPAAAAEADVSPPNDGPNSKSAGVLSAPPWAPPAAETVQACLDKHQGVQGPVWRELGFRNRYQLQRFIKKHGLRTATHEDS